MKLDLPREDWETLVVLLSHGHVEHNGVEQCQCERLMRLISKRLHQR